MTDVAAPAATGRERSGTGVSSTGGSPHVATVVVAISWALALAACVAFAFSAPSLGPETLFLFVDVTVAVVYGTVASVILARRRHVVAYLLAIAAIGGGLSAFGGAYGGLVASRGWPEQPWLVSMFGWAWVPGTLALFLVVPWLMRERLPRGWDLAGLAVGVTCTVVMTVQRVAFPMTDTRISIVAVVVVGLLTALAVAVRAAGGPADERVGLGWLALGVAVMALSFVPLVWFVVPFWVTAVLHLVCQALFSGALLVVILRQQLWDIGLAVSRSLVAGLLALLLSGTYVLAVVAAQAALDEAVAQVVAAVVVVVAAYPLRGWAGRRVAALVYGDAWEPHRAASRIGAGFVTDDGRDLLAVLAERLAESLRLQSVEIRADGATLASYGSPSSDVLELPVVHRGATIGAMRVTAPPGEWLGSRGVAAIEQLGGLVAAGLALTLALAEADATRERLTTARLQERRVIRRELHDGLGPWLAGLRLGMQGVRNTVRTDADLADTLLDGLLDELDQRIADVRELSHSLLPPAIEQLGLGPALEELVARWDTADVRVDLVCGPLPPLAPPVAAAAYAIASESVTNVAKHSGTGACTLDVRIGDGDLLVTCVDGGRGFEPQVRHGVGLGSMRERAAELGGSVEIRSNGSGTRVDARIPTTTAPPQADRPVAEVPA
ncbi:histidine kinase [Mumia flava]|nr:histidine kinase [Mumia flava]